MATEGAAEASAGAANLNLTLEEKRLFGHLFRQADSNNLGVVTGEVAVKFFQKTNLDSLVLGQIWQVADKENRGFLTPSDFGVALRLIGHAQAGRDPISELALQPGPLPRFERVPPPPAPSRPPISTQPTGLVQHLTGHAGAPSPIVAQGTGGPVQIPPLLPDKVSQYSALFERQPLQGNLMSGDTAKSIFEKSGLPNDILGRIWQLADMEQRGSLVQAEFVVAMHLLMSMKAGALRSLPSVLPPALYEVAAGKGLNKTPTGGTTYPAANPIPRQMSGSAPYQTPSQTGVGSLARQGGFQPPAVPPILAQHTGIGRVTPQVTGPAASGNAGGEWLVTPADKARFDSLYDGIDLSRRGFITGEEAVDFFGQSKLPEDILAQIWDLADINSKGQLTRDEFAVAMFLIRQQRMRRDGTNMLPQALPPNLIPPSMRATGAMRPPISAAATAAAFDIPASGPAANTTHPTQPKSALDDLLGLSGPTAPAPPPFQTATTTGGPRALLASGTSPVSPVPPVVPQSTGFAGSGVKPFMPTSSFGRSLAPAQTGDNIPGANQQLSTATHAPQNDLLGDTDPEISKKLTNETADLANMTNQVDSLSKQLPELQNKKNVTQQELTQANVQKKQLETRLAQFRALYESEAREVRALEQQLATTKNDVEKLQKDYALIEANTADLRNTKSQLQATLQAHQEENNSLKQKIRASNAEMSELQQQIEKLNLDNRQQKGLVAINKKQLSTNESERDRLKDMLGQGSNVDTASVAPMTAQLTSSAIQSPSSGANNPFFFRPSGPDSSTTFPTHSNMTMDGNAFNDVFGTTPNQNNSLVPPTTFKRLNDETSPSSKFGTPRTDSPHIAPSPPMTQAAVAESHNNKDSAVPEQRPSSNETSAPISPSPKAPGHDTKSTSVKSSSGFGFGAAAAAIGGAALAAGTAIGLVKSEADAKTPTDAAESSAPHAPDDTSKTHDAFESYSERLGDDKSTQDKSNFDSVFAGLEKRNSNRAEDPGHEAVDIFSSQFPSIGDLERRDVLESDSEDEAGGFEDDFAPAGLPSDKTVIDSSLKASHDMRVADTSHNAMPLAPDVPVTSMPATNAAPMTSSILASAPSGSSMGELFGSAGNSSNKLHLPLATATTAGSTGADTAGVNAPGDTKYQNNPTSNILKQPPSKFGDSVGDDDLDEFEGLEDAKEGSVADEEYAAISRSAIDDFSRPSFDGAITASSR